MFNTIQAAIELLESAHVSTDLVWKRHDCVESLKKLAKPSELEQEPVAWQVKYRDDEGIPQIAWFPHPVHPKSPLAKRPYTEEPLYTTPPQRKWVGLTDEEIDIWNIVAPSRLRDFVRCIEAKLREKNT